MIISIVERVIRRVVQSSVLQLLSITSLNNNLLWLSEHLRLLRHLTILLTSPCPQFLLHFICQIFSSKTIDTHWNILQGFCLYKTRISVFARCLQSSTLTNKRISIKYCFTVKASASMLWFSNSFAFKAIKSN